MCMQINEASMSSLILYYDYLYPYRLLAEVVLPSVSPQPRTAKAFELLAMAQDE